MKRAGAARRRVMIELCPPAEVIIDVGADHGHVARAVGAVATERMPERMRRASHDVPWVVADGLGPFRRVDVAVIGGMGAVTIARILERGPRPDVAVLHAQDDPPRLRTWLAANGWRIDAERLAPEAGRFAEVIRAVPGVETARDLDLAYGPRLLERGDPLLVSHLEQLRSWLADLVAATSGRAGERHADLERRLRFVEASLERHRRRTLWVGGTIG